MKIAHINNISGIASVIADYQRKQGYEVDVYVFNKKIYSQFGGTLVNYLSPMSRWRLLRKLKKEYDVWHYHYPYGSLKRSLEKRNQDKIYLKHYHGNDIRGKHDNDFCLVSTPDLLEYAPNGKWLPSPINYNEIENNISIKNNLEIGVTKNKKIKRIAHYPYYKNYSTSPSEYYSQVLNELKRENKCEIIEILNISHSQTLQMISSADIVIGKIMPEVGWYGKFELEGMALSKPVIAYVSDYLYEKYKPPIYRTSKNTFKKDLISLIENEQESIRLAKAGYDYVRKNHSIENIFRMVKECYAF